ncbi:hypothetical protein HAX54_039041 [Datura stramonium]|uniref:Uncharacterized protein n=1 Tax=Datura stramonium TaxID=4076 RepID=A0ABS8SIS8_DATST|nr:hypothetical protein [Datura stramonium]
MSLRLFYEKDNKCHTYDVKHFGSILATEKSSPLRASPSRGPTPLHNPGKIQLVKEGKTDESDVSEEDDPNMDPTEATELLAAKLESLMDQRTGPHIDREAGTLAAFIHTSLTGIPIVIPHGSK